MLADMYAALKPGGVLGIIDHVAAAGGPVVDTATNLHRIDPDVLRKEIQAAGFVLDAESNMLRNATDNHAVPMYAEAVRGKTDRIVIRFRKPETT